MIPLPKASPLSGLPDSGSPASNTDESLYSVKHQLRPLVSRIAPLDEAALLKVTRTRHLRLRERLPTEQQIVDLITRNIITLVRSHASRKGWATRKRLAATRSIEP